MQSRLLRGRAFQKLQSNFFAPTINALPFSIDFNESGITNQNVVASDSASFDSLTTAMTMLVWVKAPTGDGSNQELLTKSDTHAGTQNEWSWNLAKNVFLAGTGKIQVIISADGTTNSGTSKIYASTNDGFDGNWHLIGFTFGPNSLKLYIDGALESPAIDQDGIVNSLFVSTSNVALGSRLNNNAIFAPFTGKAYDPAIWNKTMSATEVAAVYNGGHPIDLTVNQGNYVSSGQLVLYYKMRMPPDTTSSLTDFSGNSNTGTVNNITVFSTDVPPGTMGFIKKAFNAVMGFLRGE